MLTPGDNSYAIQCVLEFGLLSEEKTDFSVASSDLCLNLGGW